MAMLNMKREWDKKNAVRDNVVKVESWSVGHRQFLFSGQPHLFSSPWFKWRIVKCFKSHLAAREDLFGWLNELTFHIELEVS